MGNEELMNQFIPDKQLLEESLVGPTIVVEPPQGIVLPPGLKLKSEQDTPHET